jgi:hypothetical protein
VATAIDTESNAAATAAAPVPAAAFATRVAAETAGLAGVVTARSFIQGGTLPSVEALAGVLRALRGAGATEDVVGFAIPLAGDPEEGVVRRRDGAPPPRQRFNLGEYLLDALDPHRPRGWTGGGMGPGRNVALASQVLGDLTRWLVGIHTFRVPEVAGGDGVWVLGRPNHAAAIQRVRGDSHEGASGVLATLAVPTDLAADYAARLAAGECALTTCETDEGRMRRDAKLLRQAGAVHVFAPYHQVVEYGVRPA